MKRIITQLQLGLVAGIALFASSCKTEKLGEVLANETYTPVALSMANKLEIGAGSKFTLNGSEVTVPITINFSSPTTRAFSVNLSADVDTVAKLVTAGTLPAGTIALPQSAVGVAQNLDIPIGVSTFTFNTTVKRSDLEKNIGKSVAVVVKVKNPAKGNTITAGKGALILVIKPSEVVDLNALHEISFVNTEIAVPSPGTYEVGSENITVNIPVKVTGAPGPEFSVNAILAPDSVTKYINSGKYPNSVLYAGNKIAFTSPSIKFMAGSTSAVFSFTTKINNLLAIQPAPGLETVNMPMLAFTLNSLLNSR